MIVVILIRATTALWHKLCTKTSTDFKIINQQTPRSSSPLLSQKHSSFHWRTIENEFYSFWMYPAFFLLDASPHSSPIIQSALWKPTRRCALEVIHIKGMQFLKYRLARCCMFSLSLTKITHLLALMKTFQTWLQALGVLCAIAPFSGSKNALRRGCLTWPGARPALRSNVVVNTKPATLLSLYCLKRKRFISNPMRTKLLRVSGRVGCTWFARRASPVSRFIGTDGDWVSVHLQYCWRWTGTQSPDLDSIQIAISFFWS